VPSPTPEHVREWSRLHGDYDVDRSRLVRVWLRAVHVTARPLAKAGVSPHAVTAVALGLAFAAAASARPTAGARVAAGLVAASAFLDGVDGAVAVRSGRVSMLGANLDRIADRVADVLFAVALARAGASPVAAAFAAAIPFAFESMRAHARSHGHPGILLVTVAERPMRVAVVVVTLLLVGVHSGVATAGAAILAAVCAVGMVQLTVARRRDSRR
jgi:phosphatidylglycerophosphate synthase